ncbi:group III truncated hemoglobin [Sediminitomix flava]|uniref:Hemoglobin n=1 Tax=Sediminitomix flava TaxID=379075 RepID=A0A315YWH6_SEDFL|nr:group III truncated hemoglobin [Sediminitomix flava]PWJ33674.1 hemoglobin [Sediminitomix flava]
MKEELKDRTTIEILVRRFYDKVKEDELIGHIFNTMISDWESHIQLLTDFWETNLLFVSKYKGNPPKMHVDVDREMGNVIDQQHFDRWLQLWNQTVDESYEGKLAEQAKYRAGNIAFVLLSKMINART